MKRSFISVISVIALLAASVLSFSGCETKEKFNAEKSKYNDETLWAFAETDKSSDVDTFFIGPVTSTQDVFNMPLEDNDDVINKFKIQVLNQKGIYDDETRFFAPVYSQATMKCFTGMTEEEREPYVAIAYEDVREAFLYYMEKYNNGNAIIIAGNSQGALLALRLINEFFNDAKTADKLVCCYAIGWKVTDEYLSKLKYVHFATGEDDTKSIVSFNCEAPEITQSVIVGENEKTHCINPLNWKTTAETAGSGLNLGCCIYSTKGYQKGDDIVGFCGAYIDGKRGTLKLTGMDIQDPDRTAYPPRIDGQDYGVYHVYDWEFFYRNLEENVQKRIASYTEK